VKLHRRSALTGVVLTAALLSGCASLMTIRAELSTWGDWPAGRAPGTYVFDRLPSQQAQAEETALLEQAARPALERAGFRPAPAGSAPEVLVQVAARTATTAPDPWSDPWWWRGGNAFARRPWVGVTWWPDPRFDQRRYEREVAILLRDAATGKPLYEARVAHEGPSRGSEALFTALFSGTLVDFPRLGLNPRPVTVTQP
jgi:hypothetical protein